jgi:hypothetical protein
MTPAVSWFLFGACIVVGAVVYVVVVGGHRYRSLETEWHRIRWERRNGGGIVLFPPGTSLQEVESFIRIFGGIYDHETRRDFDHDPLTHDCEVCAGLRRRAFNRLADRPGSPRDTDELMAAIREELES